MHFSECSVLLLPLLERRKREEKRKEKKVFSLRGSKEEGREDKRNESPMGLDGWFAPRSRIAWQGFGEHTRRRMSLFYFFAAIRWKSDSLDLIPPFFGHSSIRSYFLRASRGEGLLVLLYLLLMLSILRPC